MEVEVEVGEVTDEIDLDQKIKKKKCGVKGSKDSYQSNR